MGFFLVTLSFLLQLGYWLVLWQGFERARGHSSAADSHDLPPISVVVAARNEEANLPGLLQGLARQTHPQYEVVVVDDDSTDDTAALVARWRRQHDNVRLVRVRSPQAPRKKNALTRGIEAASYELLAFTDADCEPLPGWLKTLAAHHADANEDILLVGYSPYRHRSDLLYRFAAYETFLTGFLTAAAAGLQRPYMAVGRNLSYPRSVFERIGGFEHSRQSLSGDDDLLVQEVHRRLAASVRHVFAPATFVRTEAPTSWSEWFHQKRRHTSAGRFYPRSVQLHLALFQGSSILLWAAPLLAGWTGVGLLGARLLGQGAILWEAARVLEEKPLVSALPLLDLFYTGYNLVVAPLGLARIPDEW